MEKCISCNKMFEIDESINGFCPDCIVKFSNEYNEYLEGLKDDSVDLGDEFNEEGDSIWF